MKVDLTPSNLPRLHGLDQVRLWQRVAREFQNILELAQMGRRQAETGDFDTLAVTAADVQRRLEFTSVGMTTLVLSRLRNHETLQVFRK